MAQSLSNIVAVNATELSTTNIDSYFRYIMLVVAFEDADLITGETFSTTGYEEYSTLDGVAAKFPVASQTYKWAEDIFAQKVNTGINGSSFEKVVVVQKKTTDATYLAALNRISYEDAYWVLPLTDTVAEVQSVESWVSTKYKQIWTQDNSADILNNGISTDIASVLKAGGSQRAAVWYHADGTEALAGSIQAILATNNPGDRAAFYKEPASITVDTLTDANLTSLDNKNVNYYTNLKGTAGKWNSDKFTFKGILVNGDKIQKLYQTDRILLTLQTRGKDVLKRDIPYDNRGVAQLEKELNDVLKSFQVQEIIKEQTFVNSFGNTVNGYFAKVYSMENTQVGFPSQYAAQTFVGKIEYLLALTGEKIVIDITYQL